MRHTSSPAGVPRPCLAACSRRQGSRKEGTRAGAGHRELLLPREAVGGLEVVAHSSVLLLLLVL